MQKLTPLVRYQEMVNAGELESDISQYHVIKILDGVHQALMTNSQPLQKKARRFYWITRWWSKEKSLQQPVQGVYMWGGVGRGKTRLMDLFYQSLQGSKKQRLHFHRFMLRVHEELVQLQGHENPLTIVADKFKSETDVLCFDEFFVSDITDAMLLATLFEALFAKGITLVATSNIPPDDLYRNGLQRARFLPTIALIKKHCQIVNVDSGVDYRLRTLVQASLFITPLGVQADNKLSALFHQLTGKPSDGAKSLIINHHSLDVIDVSEGVLWVDFSVLCFQARSQRDYIELSRLYHTVLLQNMPVLGEEQEDAARRFIALVDEFYERRVKLIISAQVVITALYQGKKLTFEFQRCLSRLHEMQAQNYLSLAHLCADEQRSVVE